MAYGHVFGGIGLHLGAIESYTPKAHHPGLPTEPQDLNPLYRQTIALVMAKDFSHCFGRVAQNRAHGKRGRSECMGFHPPGRSRPHTEGVA